MSLSSSEIKPTVSMKSVKVSQLLAVLGATIFIFFIMKFFVVPWIYSLDKDFSYTADIVSIDNFYDEESRMFLGEQRSVTSFGYDFVEKNDQGVTIKNFFNLRTVEGEKIVDIERLYGLDRFSWEHVPKLGDKDRSGTLFAPRHIAKGETIRYWHVNYDTEIELVFEDEEIVKGLKVFRYTASFGDDQTDVLTHLPGVPEERGVNLDVSISVWVEPVSGWMVKYEDSAIAYFYDQETKKRTHPWNKFSNQYRESSIEDQVEKAHSLRSGIIISEVLVPLYFAVLIFGGIFWKHRRRVSARVLISGTIIAVVFGLWVFLSFSSNSDPVKIGISRWVPAENPAYSENIQGFKDALFSRGYVEGKDVIFIEKSANSNPDEQKQIVHEFLEQNVKLIYSLTTPGTLIIKKEVPNIPVVFSIVTYPVEAGIIESLNRSGNNLVGTRNWVPIEEQLDLFLEIVPNVKTIGFVRREGELNSSIQIAEMSRVASERGIEIVDMAVIDDKDLSEKLESNLNIIDALYSSCDTLVQGEVELEITTFARQHRIPSFSCNITGPQNGDLVGVIADFYEIGRLAGEKAALILEGAPPSSLITNTVNRPFIYLNETTANLLEVFIPQHIKARVKQIIEDNE